MAKITRRQVVGAVAVANTASGAPPESDAPPNSRLYTFAGGRNGPWEIVLSRSYIGAALPPARRLDIVHGAVPVNTADTQWALSGTTSHTRYTTRAEKSELSSIQADLGRPASTRAALIPIRKNAAWWDLTQDERRHIFEETSRHIRVGLRFLPAIARRLHHCRDLSVTQPFDFLTWFDYAPQQSDAFEELVGLLRATEEWKYVDRETDIRLAR